MEQQKRTATKTAQKDVHTIVNEKIIEYLKNGGVPWRTGWIQGGIPSNFVTRNPYRGINLMLLSALGYERNLFLTEKQLKSIDGAIKPGERPHLLVFWNYPKKDAEGKEQESDNSEPRLRYYTAYNIAQCAGIAYEMNDEIVENPLDRCAETIDRTPHKPVIKHKEPKPYYDPLDDLVNMPKKTALRNEAEYFSELLHQLVHSTGHHTRLDRMGLVQMPEFGCDPFTLEELVAEIGTNYLLSHVGIPAEFTPSPEYLQGWAEKLRNDKYLIFNAAMLAQKALDFILDIKGSEEAEPALEISEETAVS